MKKALETFDFSKTEPQLIQQKLFFLYKIVLLALNLSRETI